MYIEPSPKEREKEERNDRRDKKIQTISTRTYCKHSRPLPYYYPVVQSIFSLTSSLTGQLRRLVFNDYIIKFTDIFVEKIREAFALQKLLRIFLQKYWRISDINFRSFNETLTNYVVKFEQTGPDK